jgi:outer membrane protein OmpA-like peptidoglycan-associated protein
MRYATHAAAGVAGLAAGAVAGLFLLVPPDMLKPVAMADPPGRGQEVPWWEAIVEVPDPGTTTYQVPSDVLFPVDSAIVDVDAAHALAALAPDLQDAVAVVIAGATDSTGPHDHNLALSRARAEAARDVLVAEGVPLSIITIEAWADDHPVADESGPDPDEARARNRRIEIIVTT